MQEAIQAWQQFHQSQIESFRAKLDDCLRIDETLPLEQVAQQIVDQITEERQLTSARYQTLEKESAALQLKFQSCLAEDEIRTLKTQYENSLNEKDSLIHQLQSQSAVARDERDTQVAGTYAAWNNPVFCSLDHFSSAMNIAEQQNELVRTRPCRFSGRVTHLSYAFQSELRSQLAHLTAHYSQLEQDNRSWQQCERDHVDLLNEVLPSSNRATLAEVIEDALTYIQHLRKEAGSGMAANEPKTVSEQETQANGRALTCSTRRSEPLSFHSAR